MIEWKPLDGRGMRTEFARTPLGEIYADDYGAAGCKLYGNCGMLSWPTFKTMDDAKAAAETYLREKLAELQAFLQPLPRTENANHPLEIIKTWRNGCGNTLPFGKGPHECESCTALAFDYIEKWFLEMFDANKPADIGRGLLQPVMWVTSDKPRSRADLCRVLDEWNETTGALPRDSGWHCEVLGMMEDAYDLGCAQRGGK